jgi:secreted protein with Ig-like and vWFA domain
MISLSFERPEFLLLLLLVLPIFGLAIWSKRKASLFRRLFAAGVRSFLLLLLLLAMAGLTRNKPVDALAVMFVVDQSASIDIAGQRQALEFMRDSLKHREDDDLVGVVVFGADALVEMEPREEVDLQGLESAPSPHQTDIAAGVRLASALLPADRARRIIVLTDGEETRGDHWRRRCAAGGYPSPRTR